MKDSSMNEITGDLMKLDNALKGLAEKTMFGFDPDRCLEGNVFSRLRKEKPDAEIISICDKKNESSQVVSKSGQYKFFIMFAAAACVLLFLGMNMVMSRGLGLMEHRSGLAAVIRSGNKLNSASVLKIETGDILETRNGNLAAMIDNRVQLLVNQQSLVRISGRDSLDLKNGEIWVYVNPGSGEYSIKVPGGRVHVVGTSFGVSVNSEGVSVSVSTGKVLYSVNVEDVEINAEEKLFLAASKSLSSAKKISDKTLKNAPDWVKSMINEIASERLKKFFPSAVPIDTD
jgi:FecR-like protein